MSAKYEETIGNLQLVEPRRELTPAEIEALWRVFESIETVWKLVPVAATLKSQWLDMLHARTLGTPNYAAEYVNAAAVATELQALGVGNWETLLFFQTVVKAPGDALTRLQHAKFYVFDDFIRCFIHMGGFATFGGRNYTGYMGGSRFAAEAPVRIGGRT